MIAPPADECFIVSSTVAHFPIKLWKVIVHPTLVYPFQHIGIEVVIILQTCGCTSIGISTLVAIYTEGRNAKLHPRLHLTYLLTHLLHKCIHILSAPITTVHTIAILSIRGIIGNGNTGNGIRIGTNQ